MNDEECCVRVAALETLCDLISFLDDLTLKTQIVPLVKKFCQRAFNSGDNSLTTVVRLLGRLCDLLKGKPPPTFSCNHANIRAECKSSKA
jgi:hypothetical protein